MINAPVSKTSVDQKVVVSFILGLILWVALMGIVSYLSSNKLSKTSIIPVGEEAVMDNTSVDDKNMPNWNVNQLERMIETMPWKVATNFIVNGPIEKIQILSGLSLNLFMKNGPIFTTVQPEVDAYVEFVKKSWKAITIVK